MLLLEELLSKMPDLHERREAPGPNQGVTRNSTIPDQKAFVYAKLVRDGELYFVTEAQCLLGDWHVWGYMKTFQYRFPVRIESRLGDLEAAGWKQDTKFNHGLWPTVKETHFPIAVAPVRARSTASA